jgi:hypothetical protein
MICMVDLRENLIWIIVPAATGVAVAIGWFLSSGVAASLLSVLVGTGITYFVTSRTQKKAWQREYSVKIAETVYGDLYRDLKSIIAAIERDELGSANFSKWEEFQQDHRYFMVEKRFRAKLDDFLKDTKEYNEYFSNNRFKVLPRLMHEEASRIFLGKIDTINITIEARGRDGGLIRISAREDELANYLILNTDPKTATLKRFPEHEITGLHIAFGNVPAGPEIDAKFDEFWRACSRRVEQDASFNFRERTDQILQETNRLKQELEGLIEKPWRI